MNEVDLEGSVLHLTHVGLAPEVLQKEAPTCGFLDPEIAEKIERFLQSNDRSMEITVSLGPANCEKMYNFFWIFSFFTLMS